MISKRNMREIFMLLPFSTFVFGGIPFSSKLSTVLEIYKLLVVCYFIYTYKIKKSDFNALVVLGLLYEISYLIPAVLSGNLTLRTFYLWFKEVYTIVGLLIVISRLLKNDYLRTIKNIYHMLAMVIIVHIVCVITAGYSLLGIRTRFGDSFTVAIILLLVYKELSGDKNTIFDFIFVLLSGYYIVSQWISTMVLLGILLIAMYVWGNSKIISKFMKYTEIVVGGVLLNFSIVFLRIQNVFKPIIVDLLHEDLTLNNRTVIWDQVFLDMLHNNIFLGAGITGENTKDVHVAVYNEYGYLLMGDRQAHNQLLSVLYWNGIGGLLMYLAMIIIAGKNLKYMGNRKVRAFFCIGMLLILLSMITELSADGTFFIMFLASMYFVNYAECV